MEERKSAKEYNFKDRNFEKNYIEIHKKNRKSFQREIISSRVLDETPFEEQSEVHKLRLQQFKVVAS